MIKEDTKANLTASLTASASSDNQQLLFKYIEYLSQTKCLASNSVLAYQRDLKQFVEWLNDQQLNCLNVDQSQLTHYLLSRMRSGAKQASSARTISSLKGFYKFLQLTGCVVFSPCAAIKAPANKASSKAALSAEQVLKLLDSPEQTAVIGLRDKAMLELLYATGISITELVMLQIGDIHLKKQQLMVRGSARKERVIPLIESAVTYLESYLKKSRPILLKSHASGYLFINRQGKGMTRQAFWYRIKFYVASSGLDESISAQQLRKAFAVHLLAKGIDLEQMQYLLGHSVKVSTEVYYQPVSSNQ